MPIKTDLTIRAYAAMDVIVTRRPPSRFDIKRHGQIVHHSGAPKA